MGQCASADADHDGLSDMISQEEMLNLCGCDECRGLKPHDADKALLHATSILRDPTSSMLRLHVIEPGSQSRGFRVELDAHEAVDSLHKLIIAFLSIAGRCPKAFELWHGDWKLDPELTLFEAGLCRDSPVHVKPLEPNSEPGSSSSEQSQENTQPRRVSIGCQMPTTPSSGEEWAEMISKLCTRGPIVINDGTFTRDPLCLRSHWCCLAAVTCTNKFKVLTACEDGIRLSIRPKFMGGQAALCGIGEVWGMSPQEGVAFVSDARQALLQMRAYLVCMLTAHGLCRIETRKEFDSNVNKARVLEYGDANGCGGEFWCFYNSQVQ